MENSKIKLKNEPPPLESDLDQGINLEWPNEGIIVNTSSSVVDGIVIQVMTVWLSAENILLKRLV